MLNPNNIATGIKSMKYDKREGGAKIKTVYNFRTLSNICNNL